MSDLNSGKRCIVYCGAECNCDLRAATTVDETGLTFENMCSQCVKHLATIKELEATIEKLREELRDLRMASPLPNMEEKKFDDEDGLRSGSLNARR